MKIGEKISPILKEIEITLWEFQANGGSKPGFTEDGFRGAVKIFIEVLLDKMWELQCRENIAIEDRKEMAGKMGEDIRSLIKTYTDIDMYPKPKS